MLAMLAAFRDDLSIIHLYRSPTDKNLPPKLIDAKGVPLWCQLYHMSFDLNSCPVGELEETTRTPSYYVDEGYPARPEIQ